MAKTKAPPSDGMPAQEHLPLHLFNGIASSYERPAVFFSYGQYRRWHRFLVSRLDLPPGSRILDVSTGTGLVAMDIAQRSQVQVVGIDLSDGMLAAAQDNLRRRRVQNVTLVQGRAEALPFPGAAFDVVVFSYLLRYVQDPLAVLHELSRVLRPGGQLASLEFYVPPNPAIRPLWMAHSYLWMPLATRFLSPGWREVGTFLGPSIRAFYKRNSLGDLGAMWATAGVKDAKVKLLSLGGAVVMWGRKEGAVA
ncbi:MAG: class I SAM-dependent methyltransferase [Chloroflexi bacterium]|nr:class I SAM-dependent methyltransferase [Chloroflexota bacterium]